MKDCSCGRIAGIHQHSNAYRMTEYSWVETDQYGLPVSQEEYGAAADLLAHLYLVSPPNLQSQYLQLLPFMLDSNSYNTTFVSHTLTQWTQGYGGFSYNTYLPSIWSDSSTGQIVFWWTAPSKIVQRNVRRLSLRN